MYFKLFLKFKRKLEFPQNYRKYSNTDYPALKNQQKENSTQEQICSGVLRHPCRYERR